jgi:uncharacterized protein involved in exopolysaccharide biosynthesis
VERAVAKSATHRDLLVVLFKHRSRIALVFLAAVGTAAILNFTQTPVYEATSEVLIKFGRQYVYRPEIGEGETLINRNHEFIINAELEILSSEDLIASVIERLGVSEIYPSLANTAASPERSLSRAVQRFKRNLDSIAMPESDVLRLSFTHADPEMAARAANVTVELFQDKHVEAFGTRPIVQFLERQVEAYREALDDTESEIQAFRFEEGTVSLKDESEVLLRQRAQIDAALKQVESRSVALKEKVSALAASLQEVSEDTAIFTETMSYRPEDEAKAELLRLRIEEQRLLGQLQESNRKVVNVRKQIKLVEDFLSEQEKANEGSVRVGKNLVYQELEMELLKTRAELASLAARRKPLQRQAVDLDERLAAIPPRERGLRALERRRDQDEQNYKTYMRRLEEARISRQMDRERIADVVVIQRASVPVKPIRPRKSKNMSLAALLGILAGVGLAFLSELLGEVFTTPGNAERNLDLPVIATISDYDTMPAPPAINEVVL